MAYRNGTYIAFHAQGTNIPTDSDMKYYTLLKAWTAKTDDDFSLINSHEKNSAVRDTSLKQTLQNRLRERLRNSKNMILIVSETTKLDTDWVPHEIEYAIDACKIPLIIVYPDLGYVLNPSLLSHLWPDALKKRIENGSASCIHIPFKKEPIKAAISQFSHNSKPNGAGLGYYTIEAYRSFGINVP